MSGSVTRRAVRAAAAVVALAAFASGCAARDVIRPDCNSQARPSLLLMAQSVRSASHIPCLTTIPAGWSFQHVDARQDRARIVLDSDRGGKGALTVTLQATCDTSGAKRIPSDEPGTRRFELVRALAPDYSGVRIYEFPGGCVVYDFDLETDRASVLLNEASLMLSFVTRSALREQMSDFTNGEIDDAP